MRHEAFGDVAGALAPDDLFSVPAPLVGMVHLAPLPGSPAWDGSMARVLDAASRDATRLIAGGVDGILVENYFDAPFFADSVPAETLAAFSVAVDGVLATVASGANPALPVGVNVLRNDARSALAIAAATGARFIRVNVHTGAMLTDQGWITGRAADTLRARRALGLRLAILADVFVKHAAPPDGVSLERAASDCWHRGHPDALIVSGAATGSPTDTEALERVTNAVPEAPVWVGSGVSPSTVTQLAPRAGGWIAGTWLKEGSRIDAPVDQGRVETLMGAVRKHRPH